MKKRERKKCCRKKKTLSPQELLLLSNSDGGNSPLMSVPNVKTILHRAAPAKLHQNPLRSNEKLIGPHCLQILCRSNANALLHFSREVKVVSANFDKIRLRRVLNDHVPRQEHKSISHLISHPLNKRQLNAYACKFFSLLFTGFIDQQNLRSFCSNITDNFINLRIRGPIIFHDEMLRGIHLRIQCLEGLPFRLKETIVQNMFISLFNIFTHVFCSHFFSTLNNMNLIVHYRRDVWKRIVLESFDLLQIERKLEIQHDPIPPECIHRIRFLPKKMRTRPIVLLNDQKVKEKLDDVRAVLRYLMQKNPQHMGLGVPDIRQFHFQYHKFLVKQKQSTAAGKTTSYFCTADIQNCFSSLNHAFMEQALRDVLENRDFTIMRARIQNSLLKYSSERIVAGATSAEAWAQIQSKRNERVVFHRIMGRINAEELMKRIRFFALQTTIKFNIGGKRRIFRSNRGIAQGNQLSVLLCNIYLGAMERRAFTEHPIAAEDVLCHRYVDDYFMLSKTREPVEKKMQLIITEASKLGLSFGKIVASFRGSDLFTQQHRNVRILRSKEKVQWCGLAVNPSSLGMTLDYRRYRDERPPNRICSHRSLNLTDYAWICGAIRRLLKGQLLILRKYYKLWPAKKRLAHRRQFCKFAYSCYIKRFLQQLGLNPYEDREVRTFLEQLMCWIFNNFCKKSIPKIGAVQLL